MTGWNVVSLPDSSISEWRPMEKKPDPAPEKKQKALKRNPNIKKETRLQLEQAVMDKLENLGVKPVSSYALWNRRRSSNGKTLLDAQLLFIPCASSQDQSGLKNKELTSLLAKVNLKRENIAKEMPQYWRHRDDLSSCVEQKLGGPRRGSDPAPEPDARSRHTVQGAFQDWLIQMTQPLSAWGHLIKFLLLSWEF